jgi:hypothetical protein
MERLKLSRCPKGTRKNKKTGNCENKIVENKISNWTSENNIPNGISENNIPNGISENKISNWISENKIPNWISENKIENKKTSRCPKGTLKNKKTGNCENKIPNGIRENKISKETSKNNKKMIIKNDWDTIVTRKIEEYNGKTYTYLVIPTNTYVYRGFQYGDSRTEDLFKKGLMTKQDYEEEKIYDKEEYSRKLNGLFFGNLGVACYYAFNKDFGSQLNHTVIEYITSKPIYILDMSVWQNIKNVVDDLNLEDDVFKSTYGFDINNPTKTLNRNSGGEDSKMIEIMLRWLKLKTSPKINGFGHSKMYGFHSEFTCIKQKGFLKKVNEYNQNESRVPELINIKNPKDIILLNTVQFDTGLGTIYNIGQNL